MEGPVRKSLVLVLALFAAGTQAGVIRITNNTGGGDLTSIYLSPFGARSWGENRLTEGDLVEGAELRLEVPSGIYSIRAVDVDGDTYTRLAVPIMEELVWSVTLDDLDAAAGSQYAYPSGSG